MFRIPRSTGDYRITTKAIREAPASGSASVFSVVNMLPVFHQVCSFRLAIYLVHLILGCFNTQTTVATEACVEVVYGLNFVF